MFKKPFSIGPSHKVSGADRKKLRRALEKSFGCSEDALEALLPSKAGELEQAKLASPSRVVLYLHDGAPILFDPNGKGDYTPTIFALWRVPTLLPQVFVKHPAVSRYLVGGADLMLPGVAVPPGGLPPFPKDGLVAVCSPGNPMPLALGTAALSSTDAVARLAAAGRGGGKGKLVEVLQFYGDYLWGDVGGRAIPNDGFLADGVVPPGVASIEFMLAQGYESDDGEGGEAAPGAGAAAEGDAADGAAAAVQGLGLDAAAAGGESAAPAPAGADGDASTSAAAAAAEEVDMDALMEGALLQALHKSVKDTDLPLNSSVLWNQHVLPCRPAGATLDVKRSKHKKMSKFLQSYGKTGLLTCKEDKHSGDVIVTGVNRKCALFTDFRPYKASLTAAGAADGGAGPAAAASSSAAAASSSAAAAGPSGAAAAAAAGGCGELVIDEVFKPGKELRPIFEELGLHPEGLYTAAEAVDAGFAYAKAAGLEAGAPDNRTFVLNATLCDALFKGLIKKGELYPTHLAKADLRDALMRRMHPQCRVSRGGQTFIRKGQPPAVSISTEKRQGNKRVTKIAGLEPFLVDPEQVSAECCRKFACATGVVDLPGKGQGQEVVLQGNFLEALPDFLISQYGIPKKYFLVKK
ncbi:hypothetical protein HYH03_004979 [Edaphochlamys debaryana]|uniref:SUI1 domain-containing protein n=1 Tax=Edaphochlamys debaryana TaxID=47281 RepID=A0A835Y8Z7_9CHLO|nr:hypothetical protein HYH03_004979 [Edaphochlamys debaryana]|eukprot:KAG2496973.1 hypothetical protein HYH03_004979 [Edaphochlamys debaryana]